ncbi:MAG: long-chain fatty acid--CoA ligase [Ignavibacteria bacterium]|nr:long-chain fatty acid--CoA ligase [Ignavibacteria bacterium]
MSSTIPRMFLEVCSRFSGKPEKIAYAKKSDGKWTTFSHDELRDEVECLALGLLQLGIVPGERIGIVSENRTEWAIADFAITALGAVDVPIFASLTPEQEAWIFHDCQIHSVIVSTELQLRKILQVREQIPSLNTIIIINQIDDVTLNEITSRYGVVNNPDARRLVIGFREVVNLGRMVSDKHARREKFQTMAERVRPEDLLTLIYTSGTTGHPKGVMLTHKNLTSNISAAVDAFDITDNDVFLSYLPMCHSYERMSGYYLAFYCGSTTYMVDSIESVAEYMHEVRPTIMTSVPRLFERIQARVLRAIEKDSALKRKIFQWSMDVGSKYYDQTRTREKAADALTNIQYRLADKLVFSKVRARTGGRLRFFISGGAALNFEVAKFLGVIGLKVLEGYGLTETSPVLSINRDGDEELGTVGKPLSNVEIKIASDGEILARGPNVMKGYWNMPEETANTIDRDGWMHTGDVGEFNERGNLKITDRKKNILITSGGKNIAPQPIEALLVQSPLVEQAVLLGDKREFCTALLVVDKEGANAWASAMSITFGSWEQLVQSEELHSAIDADVRRLQQGLSKYEKVRRFSLLAEPFTVENGMLTPTLKVRRNAVSKQYADLINEMYTTA